MPLAGPSLWSPCPSSPTSSTPVPARVPSGTASLLPPSAHLRPLHTGAWQGPSRREPGSWPSKSRGTVSVADGGWVALSLPTGPGPSVGSSGKPSDLPPLPMAAASVPPHPAWGAGSRLRPAEDVQAIFSRNKCREIALTGEQPLFQANFHIIESNDFLSLLPAPLHLANCRRDLIPGLECGDRRFWTNDRHGRVGEGRGSPKSAALGRRHCTGSLRLLQSPPGGRGGAVRLGGWTPRTSHSTTISSGKQRPICAGCHLRVWGSICPAGLARGSWLGAGSGKASSAPSQDLGWCLCSW